MARIQQVAALEQDFAANDTNSKTLAMLDMLHSDVVVEEMEGVPYVIT
jgi:hypothetical protein